MELRSGRSRSRTPFQQTNIDREVVESDDHIEEIVRTTKSSVRVKTYSNIGLEGGGISTQMSKPSSVRRSKRTRIKTSDYSSEDGDGEISSSSHVTDNVRNQLKEEVLKTTNGKAEVSALKLYKEAGDYWNKFPKTDYTYSRHSKDRVELAPGVVVMPNMSRRSLHSFNGSQNFKVHKQTSTDSFEDTHEEEVYTSAQIANHVTHHPRPRMLFTNNNYEEDYEYVISRSGSSRSSILSRSLTVITSVVFFIFYPLYYAYVKQHSAFLWLGKKLHKVVSRVMLLDTWLLRRSHSENKFALICALCLLPLLFLGGWWLIHGLSQHIYEAIFNNNSTAFLLKPETASESLMIIQNEQFNPTDTSGNTESNPITDQQLQFITNSVKDTINQESNIDIELIVEKVLGNSNLQNALRDNELENLRLEMTNKQANLADNIKDEISKIRSELLLMEKARNDDLTKIMAHIHSENSRNNVLLMHQIKNCCRRYFVQIENYITKILKDLLGAPSYVANQQDMSKWLHSVFIAKQDLEAHMNNLTRNLKSNYDSLIEANGNKIMGEVTKKISLELSRYLNKVASHGEVATSLDSLSDEHVKKIVRDTLAIYDADKTGLVDYALESSGGQVVSTRCTESYQLKTAVISILGVPIWSPTKTPRTVITPGVTPGECWAFQNFPGFLVLKLSASILVEAFTLEHLSKRLKPNGTIDSAPKHFEVYGLHGEADKEPVLLGKYVYDFDGEPLQYFPVDTPGLVYDHIELRILSNHGNPNYTCLYRFRVHGTLSVEPT